MIISSKNKTVEKEKKKMKMEIKKSYGVLAHEKKPFYSENPASEIYDTIEVEIPEELFEVAKNGMGETIIRPKEMRNFYTLNEILTNWGEEPALVWYGSDRKKHHKILREM